MMRPLCQQCPPHLNRLATRHVGVARGDDDMPTYPRWLCDGCAAGLEDYVPPGPIYVAAGGEAVAALRRAQLRHEAAVRRRRDEIDGENFLYTQRELDEAVEAERERCAEVALARHRRHAERCPPECRCADGVHIAAAIREGEAP